MPGPVLQRWIAYLILLGLFLTFRGYRSREVDQAYRLPILLHAQDARLYADDPFVRSFDAFNPHRGYLALLDAASRPLGLSAALFVLFTLTFLLTVEGLDRLGSMVWGDRAGGLVAATLALLALAGNIGTNHLFEPMLLDRLIAFGLGWQALAFAMGRARRGVELSALAVGLAALVHPSVGLQLGMVLAACWVAWVLLAPGGDLTGAKVVRAIAWLGLALTPGLMLNLKGSHLLLEGLAPEDVRLLSAELQSPQHMLPHLWRLPQWLAWGCYPILAFNAWRFSAGHVFDPISLGRAGGTQHQRRDPIEYRSGGSSALARRTWRGAGRPRAGLVRDRGPGTSPPHPLPTFPDGDRRAGHVAGADRRPGPAALA